MPFFLYLLQHLFLGLMQLELQILSQTDVFESVIVDFLEV